MFQPGRFRENSKIRCWQVMGVPRKVWEKVLGGSEYARLQKNRSMNFV